MRDAEKEKDVITRTSQDDEMSWRRKHANLNDGWPNRNMEISDIKIWKDIPDGGC